MTNTVLWQPEAVDVLPADVTSPKEIASRAVQLSKKDKEQIGFALEHGFYEMGMNYLWTRTEQALKTELSSVGLTFIGEMLGKADVSEDDDINDIITTKEAIKLAEELGMISSTDALRLRQSNEIINHFSQLSIEESEAQDIDREEAVLSLKTCVRSVLGKPRIPVAKKFVEFREALESTTLNQEDPNVDMLKGSPYFYYKLTISVLMNAAKKANGASLEHTLANINLLVPMIWGALRDSERWHIGHTYAEAYSEGKSASVVGLKKTLLKVKGFDYVPENLRSDSFVKAANEIIKAHEGFNNFHNEIAPIRNLANLGSTIPTPALAACLPAILCVYIGNSYGSSHSARPVAKELLDSLTPERWEYYINHVLPSDMKIISKLLDDRTREVWCDDIVNNYELDKLTAKEQSVSKLLIASKKKNSANIKRLAQTLREEYYGDTK
ncbi:hypothetical protein [Pseudoalteromonas ruthenica]|uniref:hypothetical protein n=1 Tax=Pseudoalteromonas ruthenica TaxID=151081 RepID=UPI0003473005|nr:hypothetical protein [Pseudoalteromonas ruthenica]